MRRTLAFATVAVLMLTGCGVNSPSDNGESVTAGPLVPAVEVTLAGVFGDHMVIQRDCPVPIWGQATPGGLVTVALAGQTAMATADEQGKWMVRLAPMPAGGPFELVVAGQTETRLKDVLIGEVWVCSGQSNMEMRTRGVANGIGEARQAQFPNIRLFQVPHIPAAEPQTDVKASWKLCNPGTIGGFSAVGFFFGREIHQTLDVPVGLIESDWGGTNAESWTSQAGLLADEKTKYMYDEWTKVQAAYERRRAIYERQLKYWPDAVKRFEAEGKPAPAKPVEPPDPRQGPYTTGLYNGMIAPLVPYAMRGVIWYQGEANAGRAYAYRDLFPAMIRDWRTQWGQGEFPFLFVQLANYMARKDQPSQSAWAELREAQTMTLSLPNTAMALAIDIGDAENIHPRNKQDVGHRLALGALAVAYGQKIVYSGPSYKSMAVEGSAIRLQFSNIGGGLVARDGPLTGFAIAGTDQKFVWADAKIDGDSVVVSSPRVSAPVAVRYAWADNPACNLYNAEDLPAVPFRTDDWRGLTVNSR